MPSLQDDKNQSPGLALGEAQGSEEKPQLWTKSFVSIMVLNFFLFCSFQLFPSSLPLYVKELGVPDELLGWVTGLTTIAALIMRPFSGSILDRFGRKAIFLIGLLILVGVSLSYIFFPLLGFILVIRFIHGIGWGISTTASSTVASDIIPKKRFGEGIGYFSLSGSLALAIAPGIGIELFAWRGLESVAFVATAALIIAFFLALSLNYKPVSKPQTKEKINLIEKASLPPACITFFVTASYGAIITFVALHAQQQGVANIGVFFTVYAIALLLSRPAAGRIVDRRGYNFLVLPALAHLVISLITLAFADSLVIFLACAAVYGASFGALQSSLQTHAILAAPAERRGAANATFFIGFDAGIGFGSIVSGLAAAAFGYATMYLACIALPLFAALLFLVFRSRAQSGQKDEKE